jgi:predicted RNase H-like HicB family nuclease
MTRYSVLIYWSDADDVFVAEAPELPGCMAHGDTREAAFRSIEEAMELWLDVSREHRHVLPNVPGRRPVVS